MIQGEFKTLEEMTSSELERERLQSWSIIKSDTTWWIHRNEIPFMHCPEGLEQAKAILAHHNLECEFICTRQGSLSLQDWSDYRKNKVRVMGGGDAA